MRKEEIIQKIERAKEKIKSSGAKKIGVFGSAIKGGKNPKDIDILVEFDEVSFDKYIDLLLFLEKLLKKKVDLVIESNLRPELNYVKKEAKYVKL
ncbi:MAG: nucleotidyltransferase domain-containing protein [archaeon]